jgi:hypothetical protein
MIRLTVPATFWDDHFERCADHEGIRNVIKENARTVVVELDDEALGNLRSDADYYSDSQGFDLEMCPKGLFRSARATLRAIDKAMDASRHAVSEHDHSDEFFS